MRICQNEHKTYSIVLMYIRFCGATYIIMTKQFTVNGGGLRVAVDGGSRQMDACPVWWGLCIYRSN